MSKFFIDAEVRLQAPKNTSQVLNQIKAGMKGFTVNVGVNASAATQQLRNLNNGLKTTQGSVKKVSTELGNLGFEVTKSLRKFSVFSIATVGVYKLASALQDAVTDALSFDKELTKLQQVTGESRKNLKGLSDEVTRLAVAYGYSSTKIIDVAVTLSQAGLSAKETKVALEALTKTGVAATFGTIKETTEASIAIMNQFGKKASDLESILGSVNRVAAEFAVEAEDIGIAVRRAGSTFAAAGGNFNEFQALFTSVRQTTRASAESIATGLRTIEARLQRPRTQNFLSSLGIDLLDAKGQFVGLYKAVELLSSGLKDLPRTDPRFAQIAEELGGYRQLDKIIPLIEQFGTAQKAYNVAVRGGNSLTADAAIYQKSLAFQIGTVNEQFQALIRNFTNDDFFKSAAKTVLSLATAFIKLTDAVRPFIPLLAGMAAIKFGRQFADIKTDVFAGLKGVNRTPIRKFATGGLVPGVGDSDTVPAMLTPGEVVVPKEEVKKLNALERLRAKKNIQTQSMSASGYVSKTESIQETNRQKAERLGRAKHQADIETFYAEQATIRENGGISGTLVNKTKPKSRTIGGIGVDYNSILGEVDKGITGKSINDLVGEEADAQALMKKKGEYKKKNKIAPTAASLQKSDLDTQLAGLFSGKDVATSIEKNLETVVGEIKQTNKISNEIKNETKKKSGRKKKVEENYPLSTYHSPRSLSVIPENERLKRIGVIDNRPGVIQLGDGQSKGIVPFRRVLNSQINSPRILKFGIRDRARNRHAQENAIDVPFYQKRDNTIYGHDLTNGPFNPDYMEGAAFPGRRVSNSGINFIRNSVERDRHVRRYNRMAGTRIDGPFAGETVTHHVNSTSIMDAEELANRNHAVRQSIRRQNIKRFRGGLPPIGGGGGGKQYDGDYDYPIGPRNVGGPRRQKTGKKDFGDLTQAIAPLSFGLLVLAEFLNKVEGATDGLKNVSTTLSNFSTKVVVLGLAMAGFSSIVKNLNLRGRGAGNLGGRSRGLFNILDEYETPHTRNVRAEYLRNARRNRPAFGANVDQFERRRINHSRNNINYASARFRGRLSQVGQLGAGVGALGAGLYGDYLSTTGDKAIQEGTDTKGRTSNIGGALSGGAIGAVLGLSVAGPIGAAVGGVVGGGISLAISLRETAHKIQAVKIDKSLSDFKRRLDAFSSGKLGFETFSSSFVKSLQKQQGEFDTSDSSDIRQQIKAGVNQNASGIQEFFNKMARQSKTFDEFNNKSKGTLRFFSELIDTPYSELKNGIEELIDVEKKGRQAQEKLNSVLATQTARLNAFSVIITGLNTVEQSLKGFNAGLDRTTAFLNSTSSSFHAEEHSDIFKNALEGHANLGQFSNVTNKLGSNFGVNGVELSNEANEAARIIKELPKLLLQTRAEDPLGSKETFSDRLINKFGQISASSKNSIETALHSFIGDEGKEKPLLDKIGLDVGEVAHSLTKNIGIAVEETAQLIPAIKNHIDRITRSYEVLNQVQDKITDIYVKRLDKESELSDYVFELNNNGRSQSLDVLQNRESTKAELLSGGNNSSDFNTLLENMSDAQSAVKKFDDQLRLGSLSIEESNKLIELRSQADKKAADAGKALEFLANQSKKLANIQQKISEQQRIAQHKSGVADTLIFGGREEQKDLSKTIALYALAQTHGIGAVPPNERRRLEAFSKEANPELHDQLRKQRLLQLGLDDKTASNLVNGKDDKIDQLIDQLREADAEQNKILNGLQENTRTLGKEIKDALESANKTFLTELKNTLIENINERNSNLSKSKETSINSVQSQLDVVQSLKKRFNIGELDDNKRDNLTGFGSLIKDRSDIFSNNSRAFEKVRDVEARRQKLIGNRKFYNSNDPQFANIDKEYENAKKNSDIVNKEQKKLLEENNQSIKDTGFKIPGTLDSKELLKVSKDIADGIKILNGLNEKQLEIERQKFVDERNSIPKQIPIGKASGGLVHGSGVGDKIPALLTPKEFVINASAAKKLGLGTLNALNNGMIPKFADGGEVSKDMHRHAVKMVNDRLAKESTEEWLKNVPTRQEHINNFAEGDSKKFKKEVALLNMHDAGTARIKAQESLSAGKLATSKSSAEKNIETYNTRGDSPALGRIKEDLYNKGMNIGKGPGGLRTKYEHPENNPYYKDDREEFLNGIRKANITDKQKKENLQKQVNFDNKQQQTKKSLAAIAEAKRAKFESIKNTPVAPKPGLIPGPLQQKEATLSSKGIFTGGTLTKDQLDYNRDVFTASKKIEKTRKNNGNVGQEPIIPRNNIAPSKIVKNNNNRINNKKNGLSSTVESSPINVGVSREDIDKFTKAVETFSRNNKELVEALNNKKLEITINGKVEVIINGAQILTAIKGETKNIVMKNIKDAFSKYDSKEPDQSGKKNIDFGEGID